ncbi:hypothetical protein B0H17DRAFT_1131910 [Mycena rosella]|uniref:ATP-dependent DNA helicase n=1 Tax=Mycena rosella TaxID=1033263 RepID=A0AAD7GH26_MYCRO|nr:hypothetical protein B0H17DRAFT_1131910 [Mycena rosella]
MKNFNVKYECNNAWDDFASQNRQQKRPMPMFSRWQDTEEVENDVEAGIMEYGEVEDGYDPPTEELLLGPRHLARIKDMKKAEELLKSGWSHKSPGSGELAPRFIPKKCLTGEQWKIREEEDYEQRRKQWEGSNTAAILLLHKIFQSQGQESPESGRGRILRVDLNSEQDRAFKLVANHAISEDAEQLKIYLGGVRGTCKRTAAALLNGSTYHSILGISDNMEKERHKGINIWKVQERLCSVEYIFLDEVSMVSCCAMYEISVKLAKALNEPDVAFGGMNMIFASDFAQLPPVKALSLYSGSYQPTDLHNTIHWQEGDTPLIPIQMLVGKWEFVGKDAERKAGPASDEDLDDTVPVRGKRKSRKTRSNKDKKRTKVECTRLPGLTWDQVNHSCAYDVVFAPLFNLWQDPGPKWSDQLSELGQYTGKLAKMLATLIKDGNSSTEDAERPSDSDWKQTSINEVSTSSTNSFSGEDHIEQQSPSPTVLLPTTFNLLRQMGIDHTALLGAEFTTLHAIVAATVAESVAAANNGEISVPVKVQAPVTKVHFILVVGNTLQNSVAVQGRGIPMKTSCYCGLQPDKKASLAAMTDIGVDVKQIPSWDSVELK